MSVTRGQLVTLRCLTFVTGIFAVTALADGPESTSSSTSSSSSSAIREFVCFNTILEIVCSLGHVIVFEAARYGRNDSAVAVRCDVPYTRNCDIDVHFSLNRACAGKQRCSMAVNTAFFGDPCGYEEFLKVTYRCIEASSVLDTCYGSRQGPDPRLYDNGYLASPNYPGKYYMDTECRWRIVVQRSQTIRLVVYDFELDVKRGGKCHEFLEVSSGDRVFFKDCGSLGKQVLNIEANEALVRFKTGQASLAQRGFLLYYEAVGSGCPSLKAPSNGRLVYFMDDDVLFANVSCDIGYAFQGLISASNHLIRCFGTVWTDPARNCIAMAGDVNLNSDDVTRSLIVTSVGQAVEGKKSTTASAFGLFVSGIVLSIISGILLVLLLMAFAFLCHRRRRRKYTVDRNVPTNGLPLNLETGSHPLHHPTTCCLSYSGERLPFRSLEGVSCGTSSRNNSTDDVLSTSLLYDEQAIIGQGHDEGQSPAEGRGRRQGHNEGQRSLSYGRGRGQGKNLRGHDWLFRQLFPSGDDAKVVAEFVSTPLRVVAPAGRSFRGTGRVSDQDFRMCFNEYGSRMSRDHTERCHSDGRGHLDGQTGDPFSEGGLRPEEGDAPSLLIVDGPTEVVVRSVVPDLMADRCHGDDRVNPGCGCRGYEMDEALEMDAAKESPASSSSSYIVNAMTDAKEISDANEIIPYFKADVGSSI